MAKIDALETLGTIIGEGAGRDAIHVAVAPVVCGVVPLYPGQRIGYVSEDGDLKAYADSEGCGIVDPFLTTAVYPGQRFWMLLMPRSITSLRHVWSHPNFDEEAPPADGADQVTASRQWLEDFCDRVGERYDYVMEGARDFLASKKSGGWGNYLYGEDDSGALEGVSVPDDFWTHYQNVTGEKVDPDHRESFFTCAC